MNPTTDVLEKRIAALDGGVGRPGGRQRPVGDHACAAEHRPGRRRDRLRRQPLRRHLQPLPLHVPAPRHQGEVRPLERPGRPSRAAITPKTKAVYAESIGNPKLDVADLEGHRRGRARARHPVRARQHGRRRTCCGRSITASTSSSTPRPSSSAATAPRIGGVIVDSGKFDWTNGKFPLIADPDPSYHGLDFVEALKPLGNIAYIIKARVTLLRDLGPALSPVQRLPLPAGAGDPAPADAAAFGECPGGRRPGSRSIRRSRWVNYPGLPSSPEKARAAKYLPQGRRGDPRLRHQRGAGGREEVHRFARAGLAPGQRRRRQDAGHPPGDHHAPAALGRGAAGHRRDAGLHPAVDRHRAQSTTSSRISNRRWTDPPERASDRNGRGARAWHASTRITRSPSATRRWCGSTASPRALRPPCSGRSRGATRPTRSSAASART